MPLKLYIFVLFLVSFGANAQVGIGTPTPNPSSQLEVVADNRGVLFPKVPLTDSVDNQTIANGNIEGLMVFNTTTNTDITPGYYYWDGDKWVRMAHESSEFGQESVLHIAQAGQTTFQTPLMVQDTDKLTVYRNGVRIDFTSINNTTIELESGVVCYQNDEIRIVQLK